MTLFKKGKNVFFFFTNTVKISRHPKKKTTAYSKVNRLSKVSEQEPQMVFSSIGTKQVGLFFCYLFFHSGLKKASPWRQNGIWSQNCSQHMHNNSSSLKKNCSSLQRRHVLTSSQSPVVELETFVSLCLFSSKLTHRLPVSFIWHFSNLKTGNTQKR